jgi:hypothetical protein
MKKLEGIIMSFPETADRFVAYFDIMGFKDMAYRNGHEKISQIIDDLSDTRDLLHDLEKTLNDTLTTSDRKSKITRITPDATKIKTALFSDSILLISKSDSIDDANRIIAYSTIPLNMMFSKKIPIKGSLAHGKFTANNEKSKFYGMPLIDAYQLSEEMHFYGALLHHSFEKKLHELDHKLTLIKNKKIPMKSGKITHKFINLQSQTSLESTENNWKSGLQEMYLDTSGHIRTYIDNTIEAYSDSE